MIDQIMEFPWECILGLTLLLLGPWALRTGSSLLSISLSIGVAAAVCAYMSDGVAELAAEVRLVVYAGFVVGAIFAHRHPLVSRNCEVLFVGVLCLFAGEPLAEVLGWPPAWLWAILLIGTLVSPIVPVAVFSGFFFCLGWELDGVETTLVVALCGVAATFASGGSDEQRVQFVRHGLAPAGVEPPRPGPGGAGGGVVG